MVPVMVPESTRCVGRLGLVDPPSLGGHCVRPEPAIALGELDRGVPEDALQHFQRASVLQVAGGERVPEPVRVAPGTRHDSVGTPARGRALVSERRPLVFAKPQVIAASLLLLALAASSADATFLQQGTKLVGTDVVGP